MRRPPVILVSLFLGLALVVAACDDDDDDSATTSAEEAFCSDATTLETSVDSLVNLDVVAEGTNGVTAAVDEVKTDLENLKESGREIAGEEFDDLESALKGLEDSLSAAGDDLTTENATGVVASVAETASAAKAVDETFEAACE